MSKIRTEAEQMAALKFLRVFAGATDSILSHAQELDRDFTESAQTLATMGVEMEQLRKVGAALSALREAHFGLFEVYAELKQAVRPKQ